MHDKVPIRIACVVPNGTVPCMGCPRPIPHPHIGIDNFRFTVLQYLPCSGDDDTNPLGGGPRTQPPRVDAIHVTGTQGAMLTRRLGHN